MGLAAAVVGGAALGVAGSAMTAGAASDAASKQAAAANQAAQQDQAQYDQTRQDLMPYNTAGQSSMTALQQLLGLNPDGSQSATDAQKQSQGYIDNAAMTEGQIQNLLGMSASDVEANANNLLPGYQFTLDQGLKGVQNSAAARGLGVSGAALKGAADYATGLANTTFNSNMANRVGLLTNSANNSLNLNNATQGNVTNQVNRLMGISNLGENAAATSGAQGVQATGNATNALMSGANASAAGTVGAANAISGGLNSAGSSGMNYYLMSKLFGGGSGGGGYVDNTSTF